MPPRAGAPELMGDSFSHLWELFMVVGGRWWESSGRGGQWDHPRWSSTCSTTRLDEQPIRPPPVWACNTTSSARLRFSFMSLCFSSSLALCTTNNNHRPIPCSAPFPSPPCPFPLRWVRGSPPKNFEILHCCRWVLAHYGMPKVVWKCVRVCLNGAIIKINDLEYLNWVGMRGRFFGPEIGGRKLVSPLPHG